MDDPHVVRHDERCQRLREDVDDARLGERTVLADDPQEVAAVEVLHRDVEHPVRLGAEVDDAHRVRVVEPACSLRLAVKTGRERLVPGEVLVEDLHGHRLLERYLARPVDLPHGSAANVRFDRELARDRATDEGIIRASHRRECTPRPGRRHLHKRRVVRPGASQDS